MWKDSVKSGNREKGTVQEVFVRILGTLKRTGVRAKAKALKGSGGKSISIGAVSNLRGTVR